METAIQERKGPTVTLAQPIFEVRKVDGTEYPPNSLHHIVTGLQRHLRLGGSMSTCSRTHSSLLFEQILTGRLQSSGLGSKKRQAEVITEEEEERLLSTSQLGTSSPQQLLDVLLWVILCVVENTGNLVVLPPRLNSSTDPERSQRIIRGGGGGGAYYHSKGVVSSCQ